MYSWLRAQTGTDIAFVGVVVMILLVAGAAIWLLVMLSRRLQNRILHEGQKARLGLCASMAIDAQRRVVIIRRDGVEHLLLVGGPSDVVIESKIPIAPLAPVASVAHAALENTHETSVSDVVDEDKVIDFVEDEGETASPLLQQENEKHVAEASENVDHDGKQVGAIRLETEAEAEIQQTRQQTSMQEDGNAVMEADKSHEPLAFMSDDAVFDDRYDQQENEQQHKAEGDFEQETSEPPTFSSQFHGQIAQSLMSGQNIASPALTMNAGGFFSADEQSAPSQPFEQDGAETTEMTSVEQAAATLHVAEIAQEPPFASYFAGQPQQNHLKLAEIPLETALPVPNLMPDTPENQSKDEGGNHHIIDLQEGGDPGETGAQNRQNFTLNPFVHPSDLRSRGPMAQTVRNVAPQRAEPVSVPYASSFLSYPVERFSQAPFLSSNLAYPFGGRAVEAQDQGAEKKQNMADDFEQMLQDEIAQPIDSGLKIVSFKP